MNCSRIRSNESPSSFVRVTSMPLNSPHTAVRCLDSDVDPSAIFKANTQLWQWHQLDRLVRHHWKLVCKLSVPGQIEYQQSVPFKKGDFATTNSAQLALPQLLRVDHILGKPIAERPRACRSKQINWTPTGLRYKTLAKALLLDPSVSMAQWGSLPQ